MNLSNSPSLKEYQNGIPDKPHDPSANRKVFRIVLLGILIIAAGLAFIAFMRSDSASLLVGKGSLSGQVVDEQGNALNAEVYVIGVDHLVQAGVDGNFTYENIPSGERSLVIAFNGSASEYTVQVQAGTTVNVGKVIFEVVTPTP
jgi:hypothetical protein